MEHNLSGFMEKHIHNLPVRVYYSDTDTGGVVYHSRYLDMAEHGRTEMLRLLGGHQKELISDKKMAFVVRNLNIDYIKPGLMDDLLHVKTTVSKCESFTVIFDQEICRGEEILSTLKVKVGSVSLETGRPLPMPEEIKAEIRKVQV